MCDLTGMVNPEIIIIIIIIMYLTANGCHPVAVFIMHVHKYEIKI